MGEGQRWVKDREEYTTFSLFSQTWMDVSRRLIQGVEEKEEGGASKDEEAWLKIWQVSNSHHFHQLTVSMFTMFLLKPLKVPKHIDH